MSDHEMNQRLRSRDLLRFQMADDPQLSPDGTEVAWVRTWMDPESNVYRSQINLTGVEMGDTRSLTEGTGLATHPRWSPDGQWLAFLASAAEPDSSYNANRVPPAASVVGKGMQLFVVPATGGEIRQLTRLAGGVQEPVWAPDGRRLAFTTYVDPLPGLETLDQKLPEDRYFQYNRDVLVVDRLDWKMDGVGYLGPYRRMAAWIPFTPDDRGSVPLPVLFAQEAVDLGGLAWSPDSSQLAAIGTLVEKHPSRRRALYLLAAGTETTPLPPPLTVLEDIRSTALAWSPDGTQIALCGHDNAQVGHYGNQMLWVVESRTSARRCLTEALDRTWGNAVWTDVGRYGGAEGPRWSADGKALFALLSQGGDVQLCRVALEDGAVMALTPGGQVVAAFTTDARAERAALLVWEALTPCALDVLDLRAEGSDSRHRVVDPNAELLAELDLSTPDHFSFVSDGVSIDGWAIAPVGREPGRQYPTILYHGGGPGGMRGPTFIFEFQLYAAQGYGVVYCNTRGCQGYGQAFCTEILGDWGGADYVDNLRGLDAARERYDWIDPDQLLTAGGSYGGYQVNWILGREHRFRAAVSDRSVFNRLSSYGTSDIGFLREFEFDEGPPWITPKAYLRQSPLTFIGEARTPTLVVHSALDLRCPIEQGEQLYLALKRLGVPTELVRFPNESHGLSRTGRPWHRVFRLDRYLDWFARWLD